MQLVEDIINELVETSISISSPFLKTKVLASRIQNEELHKWVSNELDGYRDYDSVPEYRIYGCNISGDYVIGQMKYTNHPIPVSGLNKEIETFLRFMKFRQGISGLENLRKTNKSGIIESRLPAEMIGLISTNLKSRGNPYVFVSTVKLYIAIGVVDEILSKVRNRLLDFMLKLESEFGSESELRELKARNKEITTIVHQTIINTMGDGNVINTADNAVLDTNNEISK